MNILLTGGAGFIGSHVAVVLVEAGHKVTLYDNFCNSSPDVVSRIGQIVGRDVTCVEGDVRDTPGLTKALKDHGIDAVIHFAGLKAVGESVDQPLAYYDVNINGTISLLKAMQEQGARNLVFSSSATVYGEPVYLPIDELHPLAVTNPYGRTKLQTEEILRDLAASDPAWRVVCLRYFNPIGAHESGLIGENPKGTPNNLLPFVAQVAAGRQPILSVYGNDYPTPDGTGVRDYIHVMDLAEGHYAALRYLETHPGWQAFNLGSGQGYSVLETLRAFEAASHKAIPFEICPRRSGDVAACYASPERSRTELAWSARRNLQTMCADHWRWQCHSERLEV